MDGGNVLGPADVQELPNHIVMGSLFCINTPRWTMCLFHPGRMIYMYIYIYTYIYIYRSQSPHDDVIKWKHFPRYWPFLRGIHRSPVNSPHKGQWRRALMFSLICAWINGWVNNREAGDLRHYRAHYDVSVMLCGNSLGHISIELYKIMSTYQW